jgi:hypothetical protein
MTSGMSVDVPTYDESTDCSTSFTTLKFARLVKWTMTTEDVGMGDITRGTWVVERRE